MTFNGLHISRSGVAASQRALEVVSHNIANVSTPGHSRQRVEQVSTERLGPSLLLGPGANGAGVTITAVTRARDALLDANVRTELSGSAQSAINLQTLSGIERALGTHGDGIDEALTAFFNGWEELSLDPQSTTIRTQVLEAANSLARSVSSAGAEVEQVQTANVTTAEVMMTEQNAALAEVARLNGEIRAQVTSGDNANALMDERDRILDSLASALGATTHAAEDEMINVSIGGFEVVRGTNHTTLELTGDPAVVTTSNGSTITAGGEIGALVVDGNAAVSQVVDDLNAFAVSLRDAVNAQHGLGLDLNGVAGGALFTGSTAADFAVAAAIDTDALAASASGEAADGNHALDMAGLRSTSGPDGTLAEQARAVVGRVASAVLSAQTRVDADEGMLAALEASRAAVSGVNLDEELTTLLQYQRAYEASARVMTSVDQMLDVLINRTGLVGR